MWHFVERQPYVEGEIDAEVTVEFAWFNSMGDVGHPGDEGFQPAAMVRVLDWETVDFDLYIFPMDNYFESIRNVVEQVPGSGPALAAIRKLEASIC